MKLFYSKRRFLKKFLRACITLFMCLSIFCASVFAPVVSTPVRTEAAAEVVAKIGAYILSTLGVVNMTTNGGVTSASNSIRDQINEKVSDYLGNGVYVDSEGNYVFSNDFSSEVYNILNSTYGTSARVISNFGSDESLIDVSHVNNAFINFLTDTQNLYTYYTTILYQYSDTSGSIRTIGCVFNTENVAYYNCGSLGKLYLQFYGSNMQPITVPFKIMTCQDLNGTLYDYGIYSSESSNSFVYVSSLMSTPQNVDTTTFYFQGLPHFTADNSNILRSGTSNIYYATADNHNNSKSCNTYLKYSLRSNRSIVVATNGSSAGSLLNQSSGIVYNTSDYSIPSIKQTVIEDNNWNNIYNNYVTNVYNSYNESSDKSIDKLRQIMKNYGDNILDAIEEGSTNIEEQVSYTNEWLNKIYNKLNIITTLLESIDNKDFNVVITGGGASVGGGSCTWSQNEIDSLLSDIDSIYTKLLYSETYLYHIDNLVSGNSATLNNIYTNNVSQLSYLQNLYTLLSNVYTAILNIDSGGGGGGGGVVPLPDSDPYGDWFEVLHNIPQVDLDDMFDKFDVLKAVLHNTAPFVMLGIITVTLNSFKAEPVAPEFSIPVKLQNDIIDIDESIDLDLSVMDTLIPLLRDLILILWTIGLLMFAWWLIPKIYIIIN